MILSASVSQDILGQLFTEQTESIEVIISQGQEIVSFDVDDTKVKFHDIVALGLNSFNLAKNIDENLLLKSSSYSDLNDFEDTVTCW